MRYVARSVVVLALAPLAASAAQDRGDSSHVPEVRTAGIAKRNIPPNLAIFTVDFSAPGATPAEAGRHLAARADSLRRALATLGIPRDSLITRSQWYWWRGRVDFTVVPLRCVTRVNPPPGGPYCDNVPPDTTFRAHDAIEVHISDLHRVGAAIDTVMGRGLTDISGIRFTNTDVAAVQDSALRDATQRARAQAEIIATAGGMRLGRVLFLSTQSTSVERPYPYFTLDAVGVSAASNGGTDTQIVQPSIPVTVTVYGRWELVARQ
jgi:uncharacterized protein YggE